LGVDDEDVGWVHASRHVRRHRAGDVRKHRTPLGLDENALPLGTAYPVWTGIGAVGTFLVGVVVLGESVSLTRVVAAVLIVSGLLLMKASAGS